MRLAAVDDSGRRETGNVAELQTEKSVVKGSIFSRLGDPVGGAGREKHSPSLQVQPDVKQKYSPRRQVSK